MKLQIKTLSPLHIGNGERYNGLCYIQDKRQSPTRLCYLEFNVLQETLSQQQIQSFGDWVLTERFPNLYKFLRNIVNDRNNSITNNLISKSLYKIALFYKEEPHQRKFLGDIENFIKENNKVYIPGTEIKGAIRTAITYHLLNTDRSYAWLKDEILKFQNKLKNSFLLLASCGKRGNQFLKLNELKLIPESEFNQIFGRRGVETYQKVQRGDDPRIKLNSIKNVFVEKIGKIEEKLQSNLFRTNGKDDAKYDVLKMLHISDTELKGPSECLFVSDVKVANTKKRDKQGNITVDDLAVFQELCKRDQIFNCQGFKLDNNKTILNKLGFSDEQKFIVSDVKNIFQCCYEFSERLLDEELAYQHYPQKIKDKLNVIKNVNKPDSPVIRIGKNEGYLSLTMGLLIKDKDKTLYDNVLCHATKNTSYTSNFPKTRRVVNLGNGDVDTCGWVKLQLIA
jgi:CRISPR-associated protein Csm5